MLDNKLTFGVDSYERHQEYTDRSVYIADDHTVDKPSTVTFGRVIPSIGNIKARAKSRIKKLKAVPHPVTGELGYVTVEINVERTAFITEDVVASELSSAIAIISDAPTRTAILKQEI